MAHRRLHPLSLLCVKGGGTALAVTEELSVLTVNLLILQNDRKNNPSLATRELPLHKGAFFLFYVFTRFTDSFPNRRGEPLPLQTSPVQGEMAHRNRLRPYSLPCARGGGSLKASRRDCLSDTVDLLIIQNDSRDNPSVSAMRRLLPMEPRSGSSHGSLFVCAVRELALKL